MRRLVTSWILLLVISGLQASALTLVKDSKDLSVIALASTPSPTAKYAAAELAKYIEKSTGATLKIIPETETPKNKIIIYVGATDAAKKAGFTQDTFSGEEYIIRSRGNAIYILGKENNKDLFHPRKKKMSKSEEDKYVFEDGIMVETPKGTLYGVYEFLDKYPGIKWLWPGKLGTYIPKNKNLCVDDNLNIKSAPAFGFRKYRLRNVSQPFYRGKYRNELESRLCFSPQGLERYFNAARKYLLVHQAGSTVNRPLVGHRFKGWWENYGKKHPEWFTMHDDGKRGPYDKPHHTRMCFSNPEVAEFLVEKVWDGGDVLRIGEADHRGFCRCPKCMEWDKPQPKDFNGYSTSNRYVRFVQRVLALASKRNPNVELNMYLYMDYTHAPTLKADLSHVYGEFVPWGSGYECFYPMSDAAHKRNMKAWLDWRKTGMKIGYRPNYLLSGYLMPALEMKQCSEMIKLAASNGMVGFDYDSLFGFWATKGPMLYMHMRLGTDPERKVDDIKKEYYSAFGPAAGDIEKYFDYWIEYTKKLPSGGISYGDASSASDMYPPQAFIVPEAMLEQAFLKTKDAENTEFVERVKFLQDGLKHGKMAIEFSRLYKQQDFEKARKVLLKILDFRRKHENDFIADYNCAAFTEYKTYKDLLGLIQGKFKNFHDPGFDASNRRYRKFNRKDVHNIQSLRPSLWGLVLPGNKDSGMVTFKYETEIDNCFIDAVLELEARPNNKLEFSTDNKNYQVIVQNVRRKKIDLTKYVENKRVFYLRYIMTRKPNQHKKDVKLALVRFKLTYTKQYPDKQKKRDKPEIGTGWLNIKGTWYYKKDPENKEFSTNSTNKMKVKSFNVKDWTQVKVPARLEATAVGPYLGYGWYATEIVFPRDWAGRGVDFLFTAVDEQAWVYLNGTKIGEHSIKSEGVGVEVLWNEPFIIRANTDIIKYGAKNLIIVKTHASKGSHGIWKPVKMRPIDASAQ